MDGDRFSILLEALEEVYDKNSLNNIVNILYIKTDELNHMLDFLEQEKQILINEFINLSQSINNKNLSINNKILKPLDSFNVLDKEMIFSLNVSATQKLYNKIIELENKIIELENLKN
jgi:hypothetical protein